MANLKNNQELQKLKRIAKCEEKGWAYDEDGYRMAEIKINCMSFKEAQNKNIDNSIRHKFIGKEKNIEGFFFTRKEFEKIPIFISESKSITKLYQVAFIAPKNIGIEWVKQTKKF